MQQIAVAIVNWNTRDLLRACLRSVLAEEPAEVVVADNGSQDGSVEMVRREFPSVEMIVNPGNPGYGAASNRAISRCAAEYVVLLNSDTELRPACLRALLRYLETHPQAAVVGPRLLNPDGTLQASCFPFPRPLVPLMKRRTGRFGHDTPGPVPWVVGAALAIRRTAFHRSAGSTSRTTCTSRKWISATACGRRGGKPTSLPTRKSSTSSERARASVAPRCCSAPGSARSSFSGGTIVAFRWPWGSTVEHALTLGRLVRDGVRYCLTGSGGRREQLKENLTVWWALLRSRSPSLARRHP